jgi:hypothetical protein
MDCQIAILRDTHSGRRVIVGNKSNLPRRPDRAIRRGDLDALVLGKQVLAGSPDGFKGID